MTQDENVSDDLCPELNSTLQHTWQQQQISEMSFLSASWLQGLPSAWSPWFDVCHFILAALAVRKEVGTGFSRQKPLATWLATMSASFAGSLIANPLLGKPILGALSSEFNVGLATLIWWAVFYSPGDIVYQVVTNNAVYIPICVVKEVYRAKKTWAGIGDAKKVYVDNEMIQVMIGLIKGNGSGFMKPMTKLICGTWTPQSSEVLKMSVTSKECLVAAILLVLDQGGVIPRPVSGDLLYLAIVGVFLSVKLSGVLAEPIDPFKPLEATVATVGFGGLWDSEEISAHEKDKDQ